MTAPRLDVEAAREALIAYYRYPKDAALIEALIDAKIAEALAERDRSKPTGENP